MSQLASESRWPTHSEVSLGPVSPGRDLEHPLDARRCTVQLSTGRLYLDVVASNATSLLGHDVPPTLEHMPSGAHQLLSLLEPGYVAVATARDFRAAVNVAAKIARSAAGAQGRITEVDALDGQPDAACDFLIARENETLGRTGRWCASAAWLRAPELIVIGEAIALGSPYGAVLARQDSGANSAAICREATQDQAADSQSLARVAAVIAAVEGGELLRHGRQLGDYLLERLLAVQATCPEIESVEGNGLSFRIAFAAPLTGAKIRRRMCERGVLAGVDQSGRLALDPPLPLRIAEADVVTGALRGAILELPLVSASVCCAACEQGDS